MNLLIVTQVVDQNHPILGFFHRWIEEFSKHCTELHVICLEEGTHSFPPHVTVHSLGKESHQSKLQYLIRFYSLIWKLRHRYDGVFVHMNQIYVILGALVWRILKKKVGLWYAHGSVPLSLKLAEACTNIVFTCSADSFKLPSKKVMVTGHGIDTETFKPLSIKKDIDIITVGRITESKNLMTLVNILSEMKHVQPVTLTIVGEAVTDSEKAYQDKLKKTIQTYNLETVVRLIGKVQQEDLPAVLNRAKVFVTVAKNGSLDKAVLEAMAVGLPVISMAHGSVSLPLSSCQVTTKEAFIEALEKVLESGVFEKSEYPTYIQNKHSLKALVPQITKAFS